MTAATVTVLTVITVTETPHEEITYHVTFTIPVYLKLSKPYNTIMQPYNKQESLGNLGHQVVKLAFS